MHGAARFAGGVHGAATCRGGGDTLFGTCRGGVGGGGGGGGGAVGVGGCTTTPRNGGRTQGFAICGLAVCTSRWPIR